jgi:tetratricopeptide (TPR) repeat protein
MPKLRPIVLLLGCALGATGCTAPSHREARHPVPQHASALKKEVTPEAMYRLGRYFEGQARREKAIAAYREALRRDPLFVDAYTALGLALAAQQRYDEAIRQLQAVVVLAPHAAYAHNNLGYAYLLSGDNEKAAKTLEEAMRLDPRHERARANLRVAQARLHPEPVQAAAEASAGLRMVEVSPQVFELIAPARTGRIEAVPLPPLAPAQAAPARPYRLEICNGNGVAGLARRVAARLAGFGLQAARLNNQLPFAQARTEVQYRDGYAAEAAALAERLQHPVSVVPSGDLASRVDVRLVLGRDVRTETVLLPQRPARTSIARRD